MKKYLIYLLLINFLLLGKTLLMGQPVFKKNYGYAALANLNCYEKLSGGYITGIAPLSILDSIGEITSFRALIYPPAGYWKTMIKANENKYYVDGLINDSACLGSFADIMFIGEIDSNLQLLKSNIYSLPTNCILYTTNMSITSDGGLINVGETKNLCGIFVCKDKFYAFKLDSLMHPVWGKYFTNHEGGTQFGKQMPDGGFLLGFNLDTAGAVVAKTDSMGNILWCKSYIRPKGYIHDCVIEQDGSSIITGFTDSVDIPVNGTYPNGFAPKLFMIKLDTFGNVLWAKAFDSDRHWLMAASKIVKTADGGYTILGAVAYNPSIKTILIKTDINGDTLWTRIHGEANGFYFPVSLLYTSDHGYLIGGDNSASIFLYKTDSFGHIPCNELQQSTYVYPIFPTDSNIILNALDGIIETTVSLTNSTYPPHSVTLECDYTYATNNAFGKSSFIYPNPTTGKLILDYSGPLISDCYFSIYDRIGKLIFQRILYSEKEKIEIDLSPYGKGLYLVEFTEKDLVSVKKLIVQ